VSEVLWPIPSEKGRTKPGIHSTADNLGAQLTQSLVRLQKHPLLPWNQALRRAIFHAVLQKAVARRVDRVPPGRRTVLPACWGTWWQQTCAGQLFWWTNCRSYTLRHILTQGRSNKDILVKQCGCFNQSSTFFSQQLGHALAHSCKCRRKEFERNPYQIRLASFCPQQNQKISGTPCPSSSSGGEVSGGT